jgi:tetratricopeptide (TPR) repeat protein
VRRVLLPLLLLVACVPPARGQSDALRNAKELFFDRKYAEARQAWQTVSRQGGTDAVPATYWIARCSESLGEYERALGEYGKYLDAHPTDRTLAEEARTSRVGLAARLYKAGSKQYLAILTDALNDPARTVRYFAALQLSSLGPAGRPAVPVLKKIVAEEKDEDLVERAKLALLRLEPGALAAVPSFAAPAGGRPAAGWIRVRIYEKGGSRPKVSVNLPVALAEMVFKSLPDSAKGELKLKGYDADNFWDRLKKLGPSEIITIEGDDGERVQIWLE